jgi:DNA invertase Pin-like site-specific DNA recombinase
MVAAKRVSGQRVGYVRVSTVDQNTARQLDGVTLDVIFEDKASGKDTNRPELQAALKYVRTGDTVVVHSMDRLARNLGDLLKTIKELNARSVAVEFAKEHLTFTGEDSAMSNLMLAIMGGVAEFERAMIRERQLEGIAKAKERGVYAGHGRPAKLDAAQVEVIRRRSDAGESLSALAREFGVSRPTLYRALGG